MDDIEGHPVKVDISKLTPELADKAIQATKLIFEITDGASNRTK